MIDPTFAQPISGLNANIPNAVQPSAGQGLTLDTSGNLPSGVRSLVAGYAMAYVEFTSPVTANAVVESGATQIVSAGAVTFDGATTVEIEFYCPALVAGGAATCGINLWQGAGTDLGRLFDGTVVSTLADNYPCLLKRHLTPARGTITYSARIWNTVASNFIAEAGAGGGSTKMPGYIKIARA